MLSRDQTRVRFDEFEVDLHAGELRRQGIKVRLPEQAFQALVMLLASPRQLVTREALRQRLWPADTFVDFDQGLNKAINRVREVLGDSAEQPRLIETLPKRGYRFIGTILAEQLTTSVPANAEHPSGRQPDPAKLGASHARFWISGIALSGLAITLFAWFSRERPAPEPVLRSAVLPPSRTSFLPYNFAVSPDGSQLVSSIVNPDGTDSLWLRALGSVSVRRLEGTDGARFPFWSPDDKHIGFFARRRLETIDVASGAVQSLCPAPRPRGGSWSVAGEIVFAPDVVGPLQKIDARGGAPRPLGFGAEQGYGGGAWPHFLPDGEHFLYTVDRRSAATGSDIYVGKRDGSPSARLVTDTVGSVGYSAGHLLFVREGSLWAQPFSVQQLQITGPPAIVAEHELKNAPDAFPAGFAVSPGGVLVYQSYPEFATGLYRFNRAGKEVGQSLRAGDSDPALSPDGRLVATSCDEQRTGRLSICVTDLARGVTSRVTEGVRDRFPTWSPDGQSLAYLGSDGQSPRAYQVAVDGRASPRPLLQVMGIPTSWSAGGRLLFFGANQGNVTLGIYESADGTVTSLGPGSEGQFSPDGHWVLSGGQEGIIVRHYPNTASKIQIANFPGSQPRWRRDGREIFYITGDKKLMAVGFDLSNGTAGRPTVLFTTRIVAAGMAGFQYDVGPDGQFIVNGLPADAAPLTLLTGWKSQRRR